MLKIGITGGIGAGKTLICKIFETLGIPVYYADSRAKNLYQTNPDLKCQVIDLLGEKAYLKGEINRQFVAQKIFANANLRNKLNSIVHPAVAQDFTTWISKQTTDYILKESALLYESGRAKELDRIVVVTALCEIKIKRIMDRDRISRKTIENKMKAQLNENQILGKADYVLINDNKQMVIPQVLELHKTLIKETANSLK